MEPPPSILADQYPIFTRGVDQTAQDKWAPAGQILQAVNHAAIDLTVEHCAKQLLSLRAVERMQIDAQEQLLLPQRGYRVRNNLLRPDGHDQLCRFARRELLNQQCRQRIKQMRIVYDKYRIVFNRQGAMGGGQHHGWLLGIRNRQRAVERT
ncbi:hypothetical protein [Mycolicibacterium celeriflavum]|uniref:hypothetical protein n=1 Tax=Mycolicibacterium celeriflavum TaxID=1249101 RepID=UPI002E12FD0B